VKNRSHSFARACALALILAAPSAAFAQMAPTPSAQHPHYFTRAVSSVTLTAAQKKQIAAISARYRAAHPDSGPSDKQAEATFHAQINAVLTPAQRTQVQAQLVKLRAAGMHSGAGM
jgi:Spy/CpxP family protein refolding chaperone